MEKQHPQHDRDIREALFSWFEGENGEVPEMNDLAKSRIGAGDPYFIREVMTVYTPKDRMLAALYLCGASEESLEAWCGNTWKDDLILLEESWQQEPTPWGDAVKYVHSLPPIVSSVQSQRLVTREPMGVEVWYDDALCLQINSETDDEPEASSLRVRSRQANRLADKVCDLCQVRDACDVSTRFRQEKRAS
ncbi:hypothetical protein GW930_01915 [Candidatus Saccharibacteria bacterium]|nr:hypothetical protein [Candidatus Saccharibacteria bacterium]